MAASYRDIKADLLRKITLGHWKPGSQLPSEQELADSYGSARATVNRAMRELATEGFIERKRKAGSHVRMAPVRQARFDIPIVRKEIEATGAAYRYALVKREMQAAPDWLRARLKLAPNGKVLHLVCMHYADSAPYQFEDRWINLTAIPKAARADFSDTGPNEWLIGAIPFSDVEISFSATSADAVLAEHLDCRPGDALFQIERSTWWQGRAVTAVRLCFRRGHRMTTRY